MGFEHFPFKHSPAQRSMQNCPGPKGAECLLELMGIENHAPSATPLWKVQPAILSVQTGSASQCVGGWIHASAWPYEGSREAAAGALSRAQKFQLCLSLSRAMHGVVGRLLMGSFPLCAPE